MQLIANRQLICIENKLTAFYMTQYLIFHNIIHNIFETFCEMFYQTFDSPQVKRCEIITYKHGIYELSHELSNHLRLGS